MLFSHFEVKRSETKPTIHIRRQIKESSLTNFELALIFPTSPATISKWKNRETCLVSERHSSFKFIKKYSEKGWTLQQSNMTINNGITYFYYLLSRKK
jgi:hypothetical protein